MKKEKELLTQSAVAQLTAGVFKLLGIDKMIATQIINDPIVKREIQNLKKSMQVITKASQRWSDLQSRKHNF